MLLQHGEKFEKKTENVIEYGEWISVWDNVPACFQVLMDLILVNFLKSISTDVNLTGMSWFNYKCAPSKYSIDQLYLLTSR